MKLLIKNGTIINANSKTRLKADVLIEDNKIKKIGKNINKTGYKKIDANGKWVLPGLIDLHAHLRQPGGESKETIKTGTRAAARGGVTTLFCMPNTNLPIDNALTVEYIQLKAQKEGIVNVYPVGAITKGRTGEELAEIGALVKAGVKAISDDGSPVMNAEVMKIALEYAKLFDIPVISHCEDIHLANSGVMNSGYVSTMLGLSGISRASEDVMVGRDIILAEVTGGHIHIAHISTAGSVELVRAAKKRKVKVTCETCPHYFTLTEEAVVGYDTNMKMNPPLRTKNDLKAIVRGIKDGTIDCISTDHAPHTKDEKNQEFDFAPFGIIGLETMLSLAYEELVLKNKISFEKVLCRLTVKPAEIMKLDTKGKIKEEFDADIIVFDPKKRWVVDDNLESKSRNTPFMGQELMGTVDYTIVSGNIVWKQK
ncbi:dihydroorotase [bacterium]